MADSPIFDEKSCANSATSLDIGLEEIISDISHIKGEEVAVVSI